MARASQIETRPAPDARGGMFNAAICESCDRDASQVTISRYCLYAMTGEPLKCDECHAMETRA